MSHSIDIMGCENESLIQKVCELYEKISSLESLKPSKDVNTHFTNLVITCMPVPSNPIDVTKLCKNVQEIRAKLIRLCGEAEGFLESHFSSILSSFENPIAHLNIFPYYSNYIKLTQLEFNILYQYCPHVPNKIAFIGSGPLPLTSIILAINHLTTTCFHNYDIDPLANSMALSLVSSHSDLSTRMFFHTTDVLNVSSSALKDYEVVFLAALVGMDKDEKLRVIDHLAKNMAPGAVLMVRSAHGARAFLYPIVDPCELCGFEVLSVFHPTDEVINSVIIARKSYSLPLVVEQQQPQQEMISPIIMPKKCSKIEAFNPLLNHGSMIEELAIEEQ